MEVDSLQPVHRAESAHRLCKVCVKLHLRKKRDPLSFPYHNSAPLGITERIDTAHSPRDSIKWDERSAETCDGKQVHTLQGKASRLKSSNLRRETSPHAAGRSRKRGKRPNSEHIHQEDELELDEEEEEDGTADASSISSSSTFSFPPSLPRHRTE